MMNNYGFSVHSCDIHYIRYAYFAYSIKYTVGYHHDLYQPGCMALSIQTRHSAREHRRGRFFNFLQRQLGRFVRIPLHGKSDFSIP